MFNLVIPGIIQYKHELLLRVLLFSACEELIHVLQEDPRVHIVVVIIAGTVGDPDSRSSDPSIGASSMYDDIPSTFTFPEDNIVGLWVVPGFIPNVVMMNVRFILPHEFNVLVLLGVSRCDVSLTSSRDVGCFHIVLGF